MPGPRPIAQPTMRFACPVTSRRASGSVRSHPAPRASTATCLGARPRATQCSPTTGSESLRRRSQDPGRDLGQGSQEGVDLLLGGERPWAEPQRTVGEGTERAVDIRGAVQSRSYGDIEADIENRTQVLRGKRFRHPQRERSDMGRGIPAAGNLPPIRALDPIDHVLEQVDLMPAKMIWPPFRDPLQAGGETGNAQHVGRPSFEIVGIERRLRLTRRVAAGSPLTPGANLAVAAGADIERTR